MRRPGVTPDRILVMPRASSLPTCLLCLPLLLCAVPTASVTLETQARVTIVPAVEIRELPRDEAGAMADGPGFVLRGPAHSCLQVDCFELAGEGRVDGRLPGPRDRRFDPEGHLVLSWDSGTGSGPAGSVSAPVFLLRLEYE